MSLIKVIRHGFVFWEAPRCANPPLPELEEPKTYAQILKFPQEYRRRKIQNESEPKITVLPSVPEEIVRIQKAVIEAFGITSDEIYGRSRLMRFAHARLASMALCRAYTQRTVDEIGDAHSRHHRLVIHAAYRFGELQESNPKFAAAVAKIETQLLQKAA